MFGTNFFYRMDRLIDFKNGSGMQLTNAMAATGSAGLFGHGFAKTPIYFPEPQTDFIFSVFASNFGFLASIILILIILYFDLNLIKISFKCNFQNKLIISGILSMLLFGQIQNIGMNIALLPITGITLPFISYGGSSLISYMIILGIILNIINKESSY
jgi:cell division protein FtsW (lipid II flippase)